MAEEKDVYGYVNGKKVYSRDEFVFARRGFEEITSDKELIEYAKKVTYDWSYSGRHQSFVGFYLSDYCQSEPYASLTKKEFERLKALQVAAKAEY